MEWTYVIFSYLSHFYPEFIQIFSTHFDKIEIKLDKWTWTGLLDYEMGLAPKHTIAGKRVEDPLPVYLSVDILSFDKIDTVNMMIA